MSKLFGTCGTILRFVWNVFVLNIVMSSSIGNAKMNVIVNCAVQRLCEYNYNVVLCFILYSTRLERYFMS